MSVANRPDLAPVVHAARALSGKAPVVVVVASASYADALTNWIAFARRAGATKVLVVALDGEASAVAAGSGIASVAMPGIGTRSDLWVSRTALFSGLAQAGVDFIHSDADAIWLRSPVDEVLSLHVDIAFSSGTVWPSTTVERWGFVVCCGFFLARATTATAAFFSEVAERTRICGDDQVAVNETLVAKGIAWEDAVPSEWRSHRGKPFRTFPEAITGHAPTLRVALLPHRRFPRLPEVSPETVVAHPLVARADGISTTQRLSAGLGRLGLWGPVDAPRAAPEDAPHN